MFGRAASSACDRNRTQRHRGALLGAVQSQTFAAKDFVQ
jgi:hypothetical protein